MHNRLMSLSRNDILYLPIVELFENSDLGSVRDSTTNAFLVAVDSDTEAAVGTTAGVIWGENVSSVSSTTIVTDQGTDTNNSPARTLALSPDLVETQYQIEIDNRFGSVYNRSGRRGRVSFVNEAQMASYYFSVGSNPRYVSNITSTE